MCSGVLGGKEVVKRSLADYHPAPEADHWDGKFITRRQLICCRAIDTEDPGCFFDINRLPSIRNVGVNHEVNSVGLQTAQCGFVSPR